jgi:hypothetical protein
LIALYLLAALSACATGQDKGLPAMSVRQANGSDQKATAAKGQIVAELDKAIFYIFQAKDSTYWFGSNEQGVYRYDGEALVNFTTNDGLVSNRIRGIQEDKDGNIYFTTFEGIFKDRKGNVWFGTATLGACRFDGKSFAWLLRMNYVMVRLVLVRLSRTTRAGSGSAILCIDTMSI